MDANDSAFAGIAPAVDAAGRGSYIGAHHGVATATIAARFGMECKVLMGAEDVRARRRRRRRWMPLKRIAAVGAA